MTSQADLAAAGTPRSDREETLDRVTLDAVLDWLLDQNPPPHAMAIGENGLMVPMPSAVPIQPGNVVDGVGSALELVVPDDLTHVDEAWKRARRTGGAQASVRLRIDPRLPIVMHFVDARHRYGTFLGFFSDRTNRSHGASAKPSLFRPRFCALERDELGIITGHDEALTEILGWSGGELLGKRTLGLVHPDDRLRAIAGWMEMLAQPGCRQHPVPLPASRRPFRMAREHEPKPAG